MPKSLNKVVRPAIDSVRHDLDSDPAFAENSLRRLARQNPQLAIAVVAMAGELASPEENIAFMRGVNLIVGTLIRTEDSSTLTEMLAATDPAATGPLPIQENNAFHYGVR